MLNVHRTPAYSIEISRHGRGGSHTINKQHIARDTANLSKPPDPEVELRISLYFPIFGRNCYRLERPASVHRAPLVPCPKNNLLRTCQRAWTSANGDSLVSLTVLLTSVLGT